MAIPMGRIWPFKKQKVIKTKINWCTMPDRKSHRPGQSDRRFVEACYDKRVISSLFHSYLKILFVCKTTPFSRTGLKSGKWKSHSTYLLWAEWDNWLICLASNKQSPALKIRDICCSAIHSNSIWISLAVR